MFEPESSEPKVKVFLPMYMPLKVETCNKCKTVIAEPHELIKLIGRAYTSLHCLNSSERRPAFSGANPHLQGLGS